MTDPDLADRILAALHESERRDRQPVVRSDQLLAQLMAAEEDVRSTLYTLDDQGLVRFTRGFVAGDVVVLAAAESTPPDHPAPRDLDRER